MSNQDVVKTFAYHQPSVQGQARIEEVRRAFVNCTQFLHELCPQSREFSVALTNLEQACMWAVKSIVHNDPQSQVRGCCNETAAPVQTECCKSL